MVKSGKSAMMALAAAGGLWAWRNRDKIQGWMNTQGRQLNNQFNNSPAMSSQGQFDSSSPMTGETRRMGQEDYLGSNSSTNISTDPYRSEI